MTVRVVLEVAAKRSFASAVEWPGWSRSGRSPDESLRQLLDYGPRYAKVARLAKVKFTPPGGLDDVDVVERVRGGSGTEFGVPGTAASTEAGRITPAKLDRLVALLEASWTTFDQSAAKAKGTTLRLGPRGGGRQVAKMIEHVREAEAAYLHQLGWKTNRNAPMEELRRAFVEAARLRATERPLPEPNKVRSPWDPAYAIRRSAWHALDHAWEIEDRSTG